MKLISKIIFFLDNYTSLLKIDKEYDKRILEAIKKSKPVLLEKVNYDGGFRVIRGYFDIGDEEILFLFDNGRMKFYNKEGKIISMNLKTAFRFIEYIEQSSKYKFDGKFFNSGE